MGSRTEWRWERKKAVDLKIDENIIQYEQHKKQTGKTLTETQRHIR